MTYRPDTLDIEVGTLTFMLSQGQWAPSEVAHIQRQIEDRKAQILSGLGSASQIYWTLKVQRELDDACRVRHDPIHGWMLDRWVDDPGCWHPVGYIGDGGFLVHTENGDYVDGDKVRPDLIQFLRAHDMQRPGYFIEKAAKSAAIRLANEKANTERVLMAVDSLSTKRLKEFIDVERAIQTGDTVTMHGETQRQFDKMTEAGKQAPPGPQSSNPGVHPLRHKRDYSKGEGESYGNEGSESR
jgi:hypothetical protein